MNWTISPQLIVLRVEKGQALSYYESATACNRKQRALRRGRSSFQHDLQENALTSISFAKIGNRVAFMIECWASCLA